ncbi:hypothetical protein F5141DRAFT_1185925 [Pisolithus sp. B1]|nr:hypothetical protein F5141DRAFT_1185925 [Pisolithus sp. B1]
MVLDGTESLDVSHTGGEFQELTRGLLGDFWTSTSEKVWGKCPDYHTFRDCSTKQTAAFSVQVGAMVEAYMAWSLKQRGAGGKGFFDLDEQHTWEEQQRKYDGVDTKLLSVLVLDIFCTKKTSITIGPTDHYLTSALICHSLIPCCPIVPKVAVMVQALNLYHTACQHCPHLSIQAYIKSLCDMHGVLFHNHCLQQFSIALDVYLQVLAFVLNLVCHALQHDQPDWWLKHGCPACTYRLQDEPVMQFRMLFTQDGNDSLKRVATRILDGDMDDAATSLPTSDDSNLCAECWKNMKDSTTQKMWNVFDESGVFITVCQHGFCLLIADMVQSSEQSKYALTVTSKLLDAFGSDLRGGYNIGCQFKTALASSALGKCAQSLNYMSLVNAFHGHAHNRLCQLDNLMTYVEGLGLEDLEGCEWAFSKSNTLMSSTQYASIFHRRQAIAYYFEHNDEMEVYANLKETLQMEYWQQLVNLAASRQELKTILSAWTVVTAQNVAPIWSDSSATRKRETMCHHTQENYKKDLKVVQELEDHLGVMCCWVPEDEEWQAAAHLVANQKYQRTLDNVEQLVVLQIFKLSKMNQSGTGYKLCKHIGKALQTCLAAIQAALMQYNTMAKALSYISTWLWALPTSQLAINTYFKLCRAEEEVVCLNVEISCKALYQDANPILAYQISRYHAICSQFTPLHLHSLKKISRLPGFSGMLTPGVSMSHGLGESMGVPQ